MGNYSKKPQDVLKDAQAKNYSRVRFQQGKPILDRELNLLGDLAAPERLARTYIGNGVPAGSDGFKISWNGEVPNDFIIGAGRCLVNGYEVALEADSMYRTQPHKENLVAQMPDHAKVFLRALLREVTDAEDADLENNGDVGFETALREKVEWEVVALEGAAADQARTSPEYFLLGSIDATPDRAGWGITDERVTGLNLSALYNRIGEIVEPDGTFKSSIIGQAQLKLATIRSGEETLTTGQIIFQSIEMFPNHEGKIYFPKINYAHPFSLGGMGMVEATIAYRPGVNNDVVAELRLANTGPAVVTFGWSVIAITV